MPTRLAPRRATRARRIGALAVLVLALTLLTGCMRIQLDLEVHDDDTVSGSMVMAVSDDAAEQAGMSPEQLWETIAQGADPLNDLPGGASQEPYAENGYTGTRVRFEDVPLSRFAALGEDFSIKREGDEYVVSGTWDMSDQSAEAPIPPGVAGSFETSVSVTFPGEIIETNGEVDGNTVTWTPTYGEPLELEARAVATGLSSGSLLWLGVLAGVIVVGGAVVAIIVVSRRNKPATAPASPYPPPDQGGYGQAPYPYGQPPQQPGQPPQMPPGGPPQAPPN